MRILLAALFAVLGQSALAQQRQSPAEQAMTARISSEIGANLQCTASIIALKAELDAAQKRVKELEDAAKRPAEEAKK